MSINLLEAAMKAWSLQDANARFSEVMEACLAEGPQLVTMGSAEAAVLVSMPQWRTLQLSNAPSLKELLLTDMGRTEVLVPPRAMPHRRRKRAV